MDGSSDKPIDQEALQVDAFPDGLTTGATVLVASAGDPLQYAVDLRVLCKYGNADDTALVVTMTESANQTMEIYERLCPESNRPSLGFVDTTSKQPSASALYGETPIVFTPSPGDIERLVLALSELSGNSSPSNGVRHLVVRSLTPILRTTSIARVRTVLEQITGLRSETGLCLLGLDYTAHDEETMAAVVEQVDGILWVTQISSDRLKFEYRPARGRSDHSSTGGDADD